MSQHNQHAHHSQHEHKADHACCKGGIHRDWRFWTAVVLMLAAMGVYVASMDEAIQPGVGVGAEMPAVAE